MPEVYLGDAVYASFDGYCIWLRTGDGNNQRIALEPAVLNALDEYRRELRAAAAVAFADSSPSGDG